MFQLSQKKQMDIGFDYRHLPKAARISARLSKPNQGAFCHQEELLVSRAGAGGDERERDEHERESTYESLCCVKWSFSIFLFPFYYAMEKVNISIN
jgi:hypothetical protein